MFHNILCAFFFVIVQAQLNGEFWWLNSKLNNVKKVKPSLPEIDISDFQNDDSAKIIFRDDDFYTNKVLKPIKDRTSKLMVTESSRESKIVWPKDEHMKSHDVEVFPVNNNGKESFNNIKSNKIQNKLDDVLIFSYPKNDKYATVELNKPRREPNPLSSTQSTLMNTASTKVFFDNDKLSKATNKDKEAQNICTYTKEKKCYQLNGFVYEYARRTPITSNGEALICCILPLQPILNNDNHISQTIDFSRTSNQNRYKRSNVEVENMALKQRDFLLKRKFSAQRVNVKPASTSSTKIVSSAEDDYLDPYWNVKNTKFQISNKPKGDNAKYDYYPEDYVQEYTDELPKPGLYGLYSDHAKSPSSWSYASSNKGVSYGVSDDDYVEDEAYDDENIGYPTIDPRQGSKKQKGKPHKLSTTSEEGSYDAESHTINFHSNPDFQVFQGFKLLNLFRNTSRVYSKKTTNQDTNTDILLGEPEESEENGELFDENQLFNGCGRTMTKIAYEKGNALGEAASGSHPWMALVVLTKRKHNVICYGTLVHPRAAITVADCVHGTAPGDITVIAGLWDMTDRSKSRNRVATVHVHPRYKPGDVENNLAVLHWMRPLKLGFNVQPACLAEPQIGDECKFFGWGGLSQGIQQQRSQWQRVTVRACTDRLGTKRTRSSTEVFCVTAPRGTVTGMGGPLICDVAGRSSIVGTVVSRDNGYILLPVRDWAMKAETLVSGD